MSVRSALAAFNSSQISAFSLVIWLNLWFIRSNGALILVPRYQLTLTEVIISEPMIVIRSAVLMSFLALAAL